MEYVWLYLPSFPYSYVMVVVGCATLALLAAWHVNHQVIEFHLSPSFLIRASVGSVINCPIVVTNTSFGSQPYVFIAGRCMYDCAFEALPYVKATYWVYYVLTLFYRLCKWGCIEGSMTGNHSNGQPSNSNLFYGHMCILLY